MKIEILSIDGIPLIKKGDHIDEIISNSLDNNHLEIQNGDIILIAETIISKSIGNFISLDKIKVSTKAKEISKIIKKDPSLVELILNESNEIVSLGNEFIITETKDGFVCANAGIDESNVEEGFAKPLPPNPDSIAKDLREKIENKTKKEIAIIITDTQGRAFRNGAVGVSIGSSGIKSLWNRQGEEDLYGRELQTTEVAIADELASSASIMMGQANEGIPVVIIRGFNDFKSIRDIESGTNDLLRPKEHDVFRK